MGDFLPSDDSKVLSRLLVSQADLSRIIGKGGQTVTNIRAKCGAVIKGFNLEDADNKLLVIGGTMAEVLEGYDLVIDVLHEGFIEGGANGNFHIEMLADNSRAGRILGPKGVTVTTVRNESGCSIVRLIKEPVEVCGQSLRTILLEGSASAVQKAHFMLQQLIYENTPHQVAPAVRTDGQLGGPPRDRDIREMRDVRDTRDIRDSGRDDRGRDDRGRDDRGRDDRGRDDRVRDDRMDRGRDSRPPAYVSNSPNIGSYSIQNNARVLVDFNVPLLLAAEAEKLMGQLNAYGVEVTFSRAGNSGSINSNKRNADAMSGGVMNRGDYGDDYRGSGSSGGGSYGGGSSYGNRPVNQPPSRGGYGASDGGNYNNHTNHNNHSGSSRHGTAPPNENDQKLEFLIPIDRVGAVLGVGGRNCRELQQEYHIYLHIDKEESVPGFRKVVLGGVSVDDVVRARDRILQIASQQP